MGRWDRKRQLGVEDEYWKLILLEAELPEVAAMLRDAAKPLAWAVGTARLCGPTWSHRLVWCCGVEAGRPGSSPVKPGRWSLLQRR